MQRIAIIGSPGAGKSTLARRIGEALGVEVIHLDRHYWRPGWVPTPSDEWVHMHEGLVSEPRWIIDGNYSSTIEIRLRAADAIVFLDYPRTVCTWRVLKRLFSGWFGGGRPDMTQGCAERIDWGFLRYVWRYPSHKRPGIVDRLMQFGQTKRVFHLRSDSEAAELVQTLSARPAPKG